MGYLKDFQDRIKLADYPAFLKLWEEYCYSDEPDVEELRQVLIQAKESDLAQSFGSHVTKILPLVELIKKPEEKHEILKLIIDIQNTNTEDLAEMIYAYLKEKYPNDPLFAEKIRLIGLRGKDNFQGAISKYELLTHMDKGKFVFHTAGWGTGEILDLSLVREEVVLEFEYVIGKKSLSFENALKTLIPLRDDHFLAKRFGNPDLLEKQAKENPIEIMYQLLSDLGPKTAFEIKENLCDLVIPAEEWNKWWQATRSKIKKDTKIESPKDSHEPFRLRKTAISHADILYKNLEAKPSSDDVIQLIYSFIKDFPQQLKNKEFAGSLQAKLNDVLAVEKLSNAQKIQIYFFLEDISEEKELPIVKELILSTQNFHPFIKEIEIVFFKKRVLTEIRNIRKDWENLFLDLLLTIDQNLLRDYIFNELQKAKSTHLKDKLNELVKSPLTYPETYIWYFQKVIIDEELNESFGKKEIKNKLFEGFLILLDHVEQKAEERDMAKKMVAMLTGDRYAIIRKIFLNSALEEVKEYLLLVTKCSILTDHDIKIIHSLAKVSHPSIEGDKYIDKETDDIIWVTQEGYEKIKNKITKLSTVDTIENAKEIEEARSHGDLRENAEYKASLEKRSRLQGELVFLSQQFNKLKILNPNDVSIDKISVGTVADCINKKGKKEQFIILGPWEANPEKNILSFQSKLAQAMLGKGIGEKFSFQNDEFRVVDIRSYFD
ncbi:MAG: GreA/GreB family elongation factor [Chlamydiae bacterium]|nr:GreA/GreB family elongation factor [Chlamydiota bacterium]